MTILSVTEKFYNLFWNDMGWPGGLLIIGIALAVTGIAILSNYRMDGIFGLVPLICGIFLFYNGNRGEHDGNNIYYQQRVYT